MPDAGSAKHPIEHRTPTDATDKRLYATAFRCAKPDCDQPLYRENPDTGEQLLNSRVAHIHARREGGPRWDPAMSEEDNRAFENLVVLCILHASEIDDTPDHFPSEMLREWKAAQLAEHQAAGRAWKLTDSQVAEVAAASYGIQQLVDAIGQAMPFSANVRTRAQALDRGARMSAARRATRLAPVPADRRPAVLAWMDANDAPVADVPAGAVRVLVAPMGSGKSEEAERWFREGLAQAEADDQITVPVWLEAYDTVAAGFDGAVTAVIGGDPDRPCRVVLDDLDRVGPAAAKRLLHQAYRLTAAWPELRVLATTRPGVVVVAEEEHQIAVAPWLRARGSYLLNLVHHNGPEPVWGSETRRLLERPLTILALAARLRAGRDETVSQTRVLSELAGLVLENERPQAATAQVWADLVRLAVRLLDDGGPVPAATFGPQPTVWTMAETGLVAVHDGLLAFALPVFEQYFGAEALRTGFVDLEQVAAAAPFERWRYAIAFTMAAAEPAQAEADMERLVRINPGSASWIVDEIATKPWPHQWREESDSEIRARVARCWPKASPGEELAVTIGRWLREAQQALLHGMGPVRELLAVHHDGRLARWGVRTADGSMVLTVGRDAGEPDVVALPASSPGENWHTYSFRRNHFLVPYGDLARWYWARQELRQPLKTIISARRLPVSPDSVLAHERLWFLAQHIVGPRPLTDDPGVPVALLREKTAVLMTTVREAVDARFGWGSYTADSTDIRWLDEQLRHETGDMIRSRWPVPDRPGHPFKPTWLQWSPETTRQVLQQALQDALTSYRQLVEINFPGFTASLGLYRQLPATLRAVVEWYDDEGQEEHGGLSFAIVRGSGPADPSRASRVEVRLCTNRNQASAFHDEIDYAAALLSVPASEALPTPSARLATNFAYRWLAQDLKAVGWLPDANLLHLND